MPVFKFHLLSPWQLIYPGQKHAVSSEDKNTKWEIWKNVYKMFEGLISLFFRFLFSYRLDQGAAVDASNC